MIEQGLHREAMWWLVFGYYACNAVIQNDGNADEKEYYQDHCRAIFGALARETAPERQAHILRARRLTDELFALADKIVADHPLVLY